MPTVVGKRARAAVSGVVGVGMLLGLTACGGGGSSKSVLGSNLKADVVVNKVDGLHQYDNKKLEITLNKETSFTVLNKDKIVHNVTVPAFAIDMDVQPGQRIEVKLPAVSQAPRDGFFSFYCKFHQDEGEAGRITVSR